MPRKQSSAPARRAVVVHGIRTPFVRAFAEFLDMDAIALGGAAVQALLDSTKIDRTQIDALYWGGVVLPNGYANVGREIVLDLGLPASVEAMTVSRACATGLQAITLAAAAIERGDADVIIAGGGDSTSNATVQMPASFVRKVAPVTQNRKSTVADYLGLLASMGVKDVTPTSPAIRERTTGELMGESAERMAKRNGISREDQDAFAYQSHQRAAEAVASGRFDSEIATIETPKGARVSADTLIRGNTSVDKLASLRAAFAKDGTLTAGNSSALTDGAACVLLMSEDKAKELGFTPKAFFRSWSYVGVDPSDQLLIGPAISMPKALDKAGLALSDIDVVDIHEAFAAQVLCVLKALGSDAWAQERLGKGEAVGVLDPSEINVLGGSVAIGHPFAATGARMVTTMSNELHARGKGTTALIGICAAGGLGAAAVLEGL